jgi:LmbE family N-acetylglucosaminyl deacetylase
VRYEPWADPEIGRPLGLDRTDVPAGLRVLVLAPHPDDFDEAGIALRRLHDRGAEIALLVCSSSANGVEDEFCDPPTDAVKAGLREEEQRASLRFFGLGDGAVEFLRFPTGEGGYLRNDERPYSFLKERFGALRPELVVLPHGRDTNPDHRLVYDWWIRLRGAFPEPPSALLFRDPKTVALRPDVFFPFAEAAADWKRRLLLHHRSQQARNLHLRGKGFDDRILEINRDSAAGLGLAEPYAELFEIG